MPNLAVVGGQWGDEGKGKIVDLLAPRFGIVARYQGGPNAGHTVVFDGQRHALHHVPSGIFHDGVTCIIGPGMVVDPDRLLEEIDGLLNNGVPVGARLRLSTRAHVILPLFRELDGALEAQRGDAAIGTTKRGIGPTYGAKAQRWGVRLGDLADPDSVRRSVARLLESGFDGWFAKIGLAAPDPDSVASLAAQWWERLGPLCADSTPLLLDALDDGRPILFEGAQGAMLDLDHGTYPYVTSSSTMTGGIAPGLGVPPRAVDASLGVFKAYLTRVGGGPFPTEIRGAGSERLRKAGHEFGTTTGRPRRCGWFDGVAARYAVRVNGLDAMAITKFDVLSGFDPVRLCTGYSVDGVVRRDLPERAVDVGSVEPVYEDLEGWSEDISGARRLADLPARARRVLDRIAEVSGCPVALLSVGPARDEIVVVDESFVARFSSRGDDGNREAE